MLDQVELGRYNVLPAGICRFIHRRIFSMLLRLGFLIEQVLPHLRACILGHVVKNLLNTATKSTLLQILSKESTSFSLNTCSVLLWLRYIHYSSGHILHLFTTFFVDYLLLDWLYHDILVIRAIHWIEEFWALYNSFHLCVKSLAREPLNNIHSLRVGLARLGYHMVNRLRSEIITLRLPGKKLRHRWDLLAASDRLGDMVSLEAISSEWWELLSFLVY